jgi:hypothetical protein
VGVYFSTAIGEYHNDGNPLHYLGHGVYDQYPFKIPDDKIPDDIELTLANAPQLRGADVNGDGKPDYVAVPWHPDFGWTATLRPTPKDGDGDGLADEDPAGAHAGMDDDGDGRPGPVGAYDEDEPNINDNTAYQAQIAVWRNYALIEDPGLKEIPPKPAQGKFHPLPGYRPALGYPPDLARVVYITEGGLTGDSDLWNRVKPGDYIRHKGHGVWYQIAEVQRGTAPAPYHGQIILARAYTHPFAREPLGADPGAPLEGEVQFANRFRLVALYDTVIGPEP